MQTIVTKSYKPGDRVKALRATGRGTALVPGRVASVTWESGPVAYESRRACRVVVEFADGEQRGYLGQGILDYLLKVVEPPADPDDAPCNCSNPHCQV